ncbi:5-formyltetrahydrofolate cyclo-ligase [Pararhodospirillum oryzae]|uniref:5-formyltetrahydrofolate cyclo-ligase n=1 Tax=Pararhodospirillum oryzae TaxID=478448 RepID=A0A512H4Y1_9PROT|nr:5-formyltetrahydrofolate cyclo-ligase [Pararhodospirillum oryzae]GEO80529.1 hypothetical protein ROR02_06600 [Pararhodospirillum oryzae]
MVPASRLPGSDEPLKARKAALRQTLRLRRRSLDPAWARTAADAAACAVVARFAPPPGTIVAGTVPVGSEIDPRPLLSALEAQGCRVALPVVVAPDAPMVFRAWTVGDPLEDGVLGIPVPASARPVVRPDWIVLPLLGFDDEGRRLGQGGGYYDRTLAALAAPGGPMPFLLGLAFAVQRVETVPSGSHDWRLDAVATEEGVRVFATPSQAGRNPAS